LLPRRTLDVLLVSMPFGDAFTPSIGLSLLQPQLRRRDLTCDILYFTLPFAEAIGQDFYTGLATNRHGSLLDLTGEWIFSDALFDRGPGAERDYVRNILIEGRAWQDHESIQPVPRTRIDQILRAKRRVPEFLNACAARVLQAAPRILGFTSVFQQHVASLALAKRIKAASPETLIVFGGSNCEGVMGAETLRQCAFIDAVVSGEADLVFPELARRAIDGTSWSDLPGVFSRPAIRQAFAFGRFPNTPVVTDLDALPYPDYADYFAQFERTRLAGEVQPGVFVETSRGCWWGERMHCTFCGLNGGTMAFRSKAPDRALAEFEAMAAAYPASDIQVVDNILDLKYFNTLLPALAEKKLKIELFYETKSNLKKDQVRLLHDAGVTAIQPGIESLSDQVLKLMKKGVSGLQNIQLLKWCKQFGVEPHWNLLFGFPGESPDEYERMADLVPQLVHLPGPLGVGEIRLDRFSPNFFDAAKFGFANVRPLAPYRFIYDFPDEALQNLAYYFAYDYQVDTDVWSYVRRLLPRAQAWGAGWRGYELLTIDDDGLLTLLDTRPAARTPLTILTDLDRHLYLACDAIADTETVLRAAAAAGWSMSRDEILSRLAAMIDRGIMISDGHRYLSLAVALGEYVPSGPAASRLLAVLKRLSGRADGRVRVRLDRSEFQLGWKAPRGALRTDGRIPRVRARRPVVARLARSDFRIIGRRELLVRRTRTAS
jgi:ribosomal peptide maturation radical SAM protein 1